MESSSKENQFYLESNVELRQLLETLLNQVIKNKPHNVAEFLAKYIKEQYGDRADCSDRIQFDFLKQEAQRLESLFEQKKHQLSMQSNPKTNDTDVGSEHETDEDDDDDYIDILPAAVQQANKKGPRSSVSAEAFGAWNKKSDFKPRIVKKTDDTKLKILNRLSQSFLFASLNDQELKIIVDALEEKRFKKGEEVIRQGEDGFELFVVESGTLSCYKLFSGNKEPTFLKKYVAGDAFGELALLYNAPRAATIIADGDCLLWCLDRETFNHIVKDSSRQRREKYENFLAKIKILESMEPYERSVVSDAFVDEKFQAGEYIIKIGEEGNKFYLVEEGEVVATKSINGHEEEKEVMHYKPGDYFGERSLMVNEPRAANVIARTNCKVVSLDRHSFKRLMGPLETIMRRNMVVYEAYHLKDEKL